MKKIIVTILSFVMVLALGVCAFATETFDPTLDIEKSTDGKTITVTMNDLPTGVSAELIIPCAGWDGAAVKDSSGKTVSSTFDKTADTVTFAAVGDTYTITKVTPASGGYYPVVTPDKTETTDKTDKTETTETKPTTPATTPATTPSEPEVAVPEANEVVSELPAGISEFAAETVAEVLEGDPSVIEFSEGVTVADVEKAIAEDALTIEVESVVLSTPDAADVAKIEEVLTETAGLAPGVKPVYLDLTVSIMHGERKLGELTVTQEPVKFTVGLDDTIYQAAKDGKYIYVIRIHDGITEFLDVTLDMAKKTASFFSDRFSTYALVALDAPVEAAEDAVAPDVAPPDEPVDDAAPSGTSPVIWVVLGIIAVLAIACVIVVIAKRRKV